MAESTGSPAPQSDTELSPEELESVTKEEKLAGADPKAVADKNRRLYARLQKEKEARQKFEDELKQTREKLTALEKPASNAAAPTPEPDIPVRELLSLRSEGYSEKEILELVDEAKNLGIPVKKILQNPTFKQGLEVKRSKAKAEQNTPSPTFGGRTASGKSWEDKNLTEAERRQMFNDMTRGGLRDNAF